MILRVRGVELSVSTTGRGIPFIWAHGITSSRAYEDEVGFYKWNDVMAVTQLVRYDARGHGASQGSFAAEDYQWTSLASDMIELVNNIGAERFIVGGASMGCATALFTALMIPHRVEALILANPPVAWEERIAKVKEYNMLADVAESEGLVGLRDKLKQRPLPRIFAQEFPDIADIKMHHLAKLNESVIPHLYRGAALSDLPAQKQLQKLIIPTLVLTWTGDPGHPASTAQELSKLIKGSVLHVANNLSGIHKWPKIVQRYITKLGFRRS